MFAAVIGGGDGFDLHRCLGVEHGVHDLLAYSFPKYCRSLAHEFNNSFLAVGLKLGTVRKPLASVANIRCPVIETPRSPNRVKRFNIL